jgi:hypothetical protein
MRRSFAACVAIGAAVVVSGCANLDPIRAWRVRNDRQRVLELYGACLEQVHGEMPIVAKYCTASAESRFNREQEPPPPPCPVTEWLGRLGDS